MCPPARTRPSTASTALKRTGVDRPSHINVWRFSGGPKRLLHCPHHTPSACWAGPPPSGSGPRPRLDVSQLLGQSICSDLGVCLLYTSDAADDLLCVDL